jgi:hypothetical protein
VTVPFGEFKSRSTMSAFMCAILSMFRVLSVDNS